MSTTSTTNVISTARLSVALQCSVQDVQRAAARACVFPWLVVNDQCLWLASDVGAIRAALTTQEKT